MLTRKHSLVGDIDDPISTFVSFESSCHDALNIFDVLLGVKSGDIIDLKKTDKVERVGKYELLKFLGEGKFGRVMLAVDPKSGQQAAIKIIDKKIVYKSNMVEQVKQEVSIMRTVQHANTARLLDVVESKTKLFIVMEYADGGDLYDTLAKDGKFNEDIARFYFIQLIDALGYCHQLGICHRDLKPENILLDSNGNLKLTDFGLSHVYASKDRELLYKAYGSPYFVAPEVLATEGYDGTVADIWSLGIILFEMLTGYLPFYEKEREALYAKIRSGEFTVPSWLSHGARSLLTQILVTDPKRRITIAEIKRHPWIQNARTVEGDLRASSKIEMPRWKLPWRWPSLKLCQPAR